MEPIFLELAEVCEIQQDQIQRYGGSEGIRDVGLLQSALAQPQATHGGQFLHEDVYMMAAAYLYHIVKNHPFVDGNKRVGFVAARVFLRLNGLNLAADEDAAADLVLAVAQNQANKEQIAAFLRQNTAG